MYVRVHWYCAGNLFLSSSGKLQNITDCSLFFSSGELTLTVSTLKISTFLHKPKLKLYLWSITLTYLNAAVSFVINTRGSNFPISNYLLVYSTIVTQQKHIWDSPVFTYTFYYYFLWTACENVVKIAFICMLTSNLYYAIYVLLKFYWDYFERSVIIHLGNMCLSLCFKGVCLYFLKLSTVVYPSIHKVSLLLLARCLSFFYQDVYLSFCKVSILLLRMCPSFCWDGAYLFSKLMLLLWDKNLAIPEDFLNILSRGITLAFLVKCDSITFSEQFEIV